VADAATGDGGTFKRWGLTVRTCYDEPVPPTVVTQLVPAPVVKSALSLGFRTKRTGSVLHCGTTAAKHCTVSGRRSNLLGKLTPGRGRAVQLRVERKVGKHWRTKATIVLAASSSGTFDAPTSGLLTTAGAYRITASAAGTSASTAVLTKPVYVTR
jgi:hypothetical protein